jgi:hypothetical protein
MIERNDQRFVVVITPVAAVREDGQSYERNDGA